MNKYLSNQHLSCTQQGHESNFIQIPVMLNLILSFKEFMVQYRKEDISNLATIQRALYVSDTKILQLASSSLFSFYLHEISPQYIKKVNLFGTGIMRMGIEEKMGNRIVKSSETLDFRSQIHLYLDLGFITWQFCDLRGVNYLLPFQSLVSPSAKWG